MGNCWPKSVNVHRSSRSARPASPVHNNKRTIFKNLPSPPAADQGGGADGGGAAPPPSGGTPNLKMFTLAELRSATRDFRPDSILGEGGFGRVFRGYIDEKTYAPSKAGHGMPVAVKMSSPDSEQGLNEWQAEVRLLGKFSHPNLVKLLGYCWEDKHFLLVYEYMPKGSLESHLFRKGAAEPIPWDTRVKIAIGAARGLAFLHSTGEKQVIYRDFKASNILLDGEFNAKISDFGLAKLGPVDGNSHVTTKVVGTYGYAAPEYMATGHLYVKSDVYGFGVVLLELITGRRVLDLNRPSGQSNLVEWAKPFLPNRKKLQEIVDPGLEGQYSSKGLYEIAELILRCLEPDPKHRPSMKEVLANLEQISVKPKKLEGKSKQDRHCCRVRSSLHNHHGRGEARGNMVRSPLHNHHGRGEARGNMVRSPLHKHGGARGNMVGPSAHNNLNVALR